MITVKKIEAVLKIMIASLFLVLFIYPRDVYAQQCNNDGVECCVLDANDVCTGSTFPGDCDGSCNATCGGAEIVGGGCSWAGSTPPPGGGGYNYASCGGGRNPTGGVIYLPGSNFSCMGGGGCDAWFPSSRAPNDECGGVNRGDCNVSQLCCSPGQTVECGNIVSANDILPSDVSLPGYYNCQGANQARVAVYQNEGEPRIYCRSGCGCVTPCGTRPGTTRTCSLESFENYTKEVSDSSLRTCNLSYYDPTDDDDQWISTTLNRCSQEWQVVVECEEDGACSRGRRLVNVCIYNLNCIRRATVCRCASSCTPTAPSIPTLTSPANGASITSTQNSLTWNVSSQTWGNNCGTANNSYSVYVGPNASSLSLYGTTSGSIGNITHNGVSGNNYCWRVRANNGAATTDSAVWCFTINSFTTPWWQVKDGDVTDWINYSTKAIFSVFLASAQTESSRI